MHAVHNSIKNGFVDTISSSHSSHKFNFEAASTLSAVPDGLYQGNYHPLDELSWLFPPPSSTDTLSHYVVVLTNNGNGIYKCEAGALR